MVGRDGVIFCKGKTCRVSGLRRVGVDGNAGAEAPAQKGSFSARLKPCPDTCAVPTGLPGQFVKSAFPTLKRGANKRRAYGALNRTLLIWLSTKPVPFKTGNIERTG